MLDPAHAQHDGVYAMWYGKAPGVDRSGDVIRHGNASGTSPRGGVLVIAGDDHECKSSTLPSQSEYAFVDWGIPVLNPASVQEVLDYGLYGWALSRFAGCWVGMVALADTMDSSATVDANLEPRLDRAARGLRGAPGRPSLPASSVPPLELEKRAHLYRIQAALAFGRANQPEPHRSRSRGERAWLGIVSTGKSYLDLCQALEDLAIDPVELGIRVYKVGMSWPLERSGILEFARGLDEILVVEEKRGLIEDQIKQFLFHARGARPRVVGKLDDRGEPLQAATGALSAGTIALAIARRLPERLQNDRLRQRMAAWREVARRIAHEIKNPLTPIQLSAQRIRRRFRDRFASEPADAQVFDECVDTIESHVDGLKLLVNEFSQFARLPAAAPKPDDLNQLVQETVSSYAGKEGVRFEVELDPTLPLVDFDREQIRRLLTNLLDNACAALADTGRAGAVAVRTLHDAPLQAARFEIADNGVGIPPGDRRRIFEPYFSTKAHGTGLGLAIVSRIVADHQGYIRVHREPPARDPLHHRVAGTRRVARHGSHPERGA